MQPARTSTFWQPPLEQSWQTPWLQANPCPQWTPHAPQLLGSVAIVVQMPPQTA